VTLQWELQQHGGDIVLGIELERSAMAEGPFETLVQLPGSALSYTDWSVALGTSWYRLVLQSTRGRVAGPAIEVTRESVRRSRLKSATELGDGSVLLRYELARDSIVRFTLFDVRGRVVTRSDLGNQTAGTHATTWDRRDLHGKATRRGLYLLQLETTDNLLTTKLLLRR
jgi:hypothetical protein